MSLAPSGELPTWIEVHVDDERLSRDPAHWPAARARILDIARVADERGAAISFRFREHFARHAQGTGLLADLVRRGHEVGAHAHGTRLARTIAAIDVPVRVAAPGLVQVGLAGRAALLRQAAALGVERVTDHCATPSWAYEGLLPRLEEGLCVMAPTVRPFDWGLYERDGTRHALGGKHVDLLRALRRQAHAQGARYFGLTLHEHDLPRPALLAPFLGPEVVVSAAIPGPTPAPTAQRPPPSDQRIRWARAVNMAVGVARRAPRPIRGRPAGGGEELRLAVGGRAIAVTRYAGAAPRAACVLSHSGRVGGRTLGLSPFGLPLRRLLHAGWVVWLYDRSGTGDSPAGRRRPGWLAPGNPAHVEDWRAVLGRARAEGLPTVALSWSSGIIPVLRAALSGDAPDALVDGEAPADRWSLVPPDPSARRGVGPWSRDPWDDASWRLLEPAPMLARLSLPYARLQGQRDHVHGELVEHAERMVAAAGGPVRSLRVLEGRLHGHGEQALAALEWAITQSGSA